SPDWSVSGCAISRTSSASVIADPFGFARKYLARPGSVTRERLRRWSAKNLRNTGRRPERMGACSGRLSHRLLVRSHGKCLADRLAPLRQFLRRRAVAALSRRRAWLLQWPIRHRPE